MSFVVFLAVGVVAGLGAGLLGIGGGLLIVPALAYAFGLTHGPDLAMHLAVATSLASIVLTGSSSAWQHHRRGSVDWARLTYLLPGLVIGCFLGARLASGVDGRWLQGAFGVFALVMAWRWWRRGEGSRQGKAGARLLLPFGFGNGLLSAFLGIGGGGLNVPLLRWCGLTMQRAVGTASAAGVPMAASGALGFALAGWGAVAPMALGWIHLPALAGLVIASVPCAAIGAALAHRLSSRRLELIFALFLTVLGSYMLLRSMWFT